MYSIEDLEIDHNHPVNEQIVKNSVRSVFNESEIKENELLQDNCSIDVGQSRRLLWEKFP